MTVNDLVGKTGNVLSVVSGPPLLREVVLKAVMQLQYRLYLESSVHLDAWQRINGTGRSYCSTRAEKSPLEWQTVI